MAVPTIISIPVAGFGAISYAYEVELVLDPTHLTYGYGYGVFGTYPSYDYFDVLSIDGGAYGYGTDQRSLFPGIYQYGWGFEETTAIAGDQSDLVKVIATVKENGGVPYSPEGIPVLFTGGTGIIFTDRIAYTDANGQAEIYIRIDSSLYRNIDKYGGDPKTAEMPNLGFVTISASVIGKHREDGDWDEYIPAVSIQSLGEDVSISIIIPITGYGYGG